MERKDVMGKQYYSTNDVVKEIYKAHNKKVCVEDIRLGCKDSQMYGFQIEHVKMANRFYVTKKGLKDLIHYFSQQTQS